MGKRIYLKNNWELRLLNNNGVKTPLRNDFKIKTQVPGTVHTDLLNAGIIPEPFSDDNETKLSWIAECDWIYETRFNLSKSIKGKNNLHLVFEGIDTIAEAELNGRKILDAQNMFLRYEVNVGDILREKNNELKVKIFSAVKEGRELEVQYGQLQSGTPDGKRLYLRKAQYSFGWDWGPSFPTMGIWKEVYLKSKDEVEVNDINFVTKKINDNSAIVKLAFRIEGKPSQESFVKIILRNKKQILESQLKLYEAGYIEETIEIPEPELWYPNGEGRQNLYTLRISIVDNSDRVLFETSKKVGIRTIKLQLKERGRSTFRFIVNGKPVFIKGVNWIPADMFLPRVKGSKYSALLKLAKELNVNMIRVWGGGIYEDEKFYEACDKLGLLVWQDFMFACGAYPEHKDFIENVKEEILFNVKRLRIHPSVAIWCGNNENEWIWSFTHNSPVDRMPGFKIFSDVIPKLLKATKTSGPYWQSSPFGFDEDPNSQNSGNRHQWVIWSGWEDYKNVIKDNSLFVTEFGFQAPANLDTFKKYLTSSNLKIQSRVFEFHNKQVEGPERVLRFLAGHLPLPESFEDYVYLGQLNQGLALKTCIDHWRLNGPRTNGTIIWQLNDVWPVTSWSLIDSELKPKTAFYFVKNSFARTITVFRKASDKLNLFLINDDNRFEGYAKIRSFEAATGELLFEETEEIMAKSKDKVKLRSYRIELLKAPTDSILIVTLLNKKGEIVHRNFYVEQKWKYLKLAKANIEIKKSKDGFTISTDKPAYFLDIYVKGVSFSKRGLILLPDEERSIIILNKETRVNDTNSIKVFTLNNYLCNN